MVTIYHKRGRGRGALKTTEICSLTVPEARTSKFKCWQSRALSEESKGKSNSDIKNRPVDTVREEGETKRESSIDVLLYVK